LASLTAPFSLLATIRITSRRDVARCRGSKSPPRNENVPFACLLLLSRAAPRPRRLSLAQM
jgi:hypothetical protein